MTVSIVLCVIDCITRSQINIFTNKKINDIADVLFLTRKLKTNFPRIGDTMVNSLQLYNTCR